jgi:hypothetical protein
MNRRQFLARASSSLVASWALSSTMRPANALGEEALSIPFATPVFLMKYPQAVSDYRCVVNSTASLLIFERMIGTSTHLYSLDLTNPTATPQPFVPTLKLSTRPDWSWQTGRVAFSNGPGIWLADSGGGNLTNLPGTAGMVYPAWYPDGNLLAVYNNQIKPPHPVPRTSQIDSSGALLQDVMANDTIWAGFPSVNQANKNLIAFAGQTVKPKGVYNQDKNYIWITDASTNPPTVKTLAPNAPPKFDPNFQGRAPWYSPNGNWIAFESNRFNTSGLYSIFIQIADGSTPAVRVTDPRWNANHAKWYPNGTELVVSVAQKFGDTKRGIAKLDVSAFVP